MPRLVVTPAALQADWMRLILSPSTETLSSAYRASAATLSHRQQVEAVIYDSSTNFKMYESYHIILLGPLVVCVAWYIVVRGVMDQPVCMKHARLNLQDNRG
ncbi:hypothetical protein VTO42DRAFT_1743 [Malbranchea cinnamomea]